MKHCLFKNETIVKSIDTFHAAKNVRPLVEKKKKKKSKPNENRVENFEKGKKKKGREGKKNAFAPESARTIGLLSTVVALQRGRPMKRSRTQTPWKSDKRGAGMAFNGCLNEACAGREMSRRYSIATIGQTISATWTQLAKCRRCDSLHVVARC